MRVSIEVAVDLAEGMDRQRSGVSERFFCCEYEIEDENGNENANEGKY